MKPLFVLFSFTCLSLITSCNNKVVPLQQTYQDKPYQFSVAASKDQVWTRLIDVLTSKGLAIKTIDKNSGLITTDHTSFLSSYFFESKNGSLTNPNAIVVCTKVRGPFTFATSLKPESIAGQWTVITKQADDKTLVDIRLTNASGKVVVVEDGGTYGQGVTRETHNLLVKSTGVFEKSVENDLK